MVYFSGLLLLRLSIFTLSIYSKLMLTSINPATGETIKSYQPHTKEEIKNKLAQSLSAQQVWQSWTVAARAEGLKRMADKLEERLEACALLMTQEMGKPIAQSRNELKKCALNLRYYAEHGPAMIADEPVETEGSNSFISYQPLGVVLAIMPWNFPFWQVFRCVAPILLAGNGMVLKHASNVSGCALAIEALIQAANLPEGLFHTLLVPGKEVEALIADPAIHAVTFTGSTEAGSQVAAAAGSHIKKQVLELGGSDPYVVLDDADLDLTVKVCTEARLVNSGQSCVAAKRFIVTQSVFGEFEQSFVAAMKAATFGDPQDEAHTIGPMARADLRDALHRQVQDSIEKGAKLLCGGVIPEGPGAYYPPTVLSNVRKGMPAYDEEMFGPVAALIEAKDEADAIRLANDNVYGLGAAVFTRDVKKGARIAATELTAGNCFVNTQVHSDPRMPFGGAKKSGYGRELSRFGIQEFCLIKSVFVK